ncbi:hypothetical protein K438DRAFT_1624089, partial [Mycena galopus ATCC 62051]
ILFDFNAQHDCVAAKCDVSGIREVMQERKKTGRTEACIKYKSLKRYIINLHGFHNAHLLREVLPRHLHAHIPLFENREETHHQLTTRVRGRNAEGSCTEETSPSGCRRRRQR